MSFISGMKKKAGEMVSQMMDEDGGRDAEPMRREVERIEASLQAQLKELKGFVTGMNSMLGAALNAAQLYRDEGGDVKLANTMCDAEHALAKDMVKVLATWLNTEVQRPAMQALERTKTARAELAERARANSDLMSAEKRMVGPAQLQELQERMQRCDMHARQSLEELDQQVQELAGRCAGGIVSCQRIMVHELGRLEFRGQPERATLTSLNQSAPPGWEDYLSAADSAVQSPRRAGSEPPPRDREADERRLAQQEQERRRAEAQAEAERERQRQRQEEHDRERRRREEEADAARQQAATPPTGDIFDMGVSSGESSAPPAVHQRTNSAGLDNFFGASSGDVPAPQVAPTAAAPASSGSGTGDLFGSPAAAALPADNFAAFGDFAPAPKPPADNFADFAAAPSPAPTPAPALDDDFFGFSGAQAPQPPAANSAGKPSGNLFSPPQAPATAPKSTGLDDLFGFADSAPAEAHPNAHGRTQGHPMADSESAAISAMRQREAAQDALEAEKMMFVHEVEAEVVKWGGPDYDPKNIRALLAGFHTIWKDDRWQPCGIQELLTPANVKKKYRRAIVLVHPDKQKGKQPAQVMLAERVFEKLKAEWAKIQDEVGDTAAPVTQQAAGPVNAAWGIDNSDEVKGD